MFIYQSFQPKLLRPGLPGPLRSRQLPRGDGHEQDCLARFGELGRAARNHHVHGLPQDQDVGHPHRGERRHGQGKDVLARRAERG